MSNINNINNGIGVSFVFLILSVSSTVIKKFFQYIKELWILSAGKYLEINVVQRPHCSEDRNESQM